MLNLQDWGSGHSNDIFTTHFFSKLIFLQSAFQLTFSLHTLFLLFVRHVVSRHLSWGCVCAPLLNRVWHFFDPMDRSPPSSSIHGISQARILGWDAISFSRETSQPRDRTQVSCFSRRFSTTEPQGNPSWGFEVVNKKKGVWAFWHATTHGPVVSSRADETRRENSGLKQQWYLDVVRHSVEQHDLEKGKSQGRLAYN